jgi:hypothetical protein
LPARSDASQRDVGHAQPVASSSRCNGLNLRATASISATAPSATVSSAYSGTLTMGMRRRLAASMSIASMPTPYLTMPFNRLALSMICAGTGV